jgi:glycogen synthase
MKDKFVFEISWEVCNKVGGIYTVLSSKIKFMKNKYNNNYFLIGPYEPEGMKSDFEHQPLPDFLKNVFEEMRGLGIDCHYGKWLIQDEPSVILIDFNNYSFNNNEIKRILWDEFKIDSLGTAFFDFDRPVLWSWCVGMLLNKIEKVIDSDIVGHFHEWLSGAGLLYLKINKSKIAKVFTTHATSLGRTLIDHQIDIYTDLDKIVPEDEARKHGMIAKFHLEKQSAINSDIFTTVSDTTSDEAEKILGRKPDIITYNGLDIESVATIEQISNRRKTSKSKIIELIIQSFSPSMQLNLNNTNIFAIFGRYEMRAKGIDVLSEALGLLNQRLKDEKSTDNVVCLYFIPAAASGVRKELLISKGKLGIIRSALEEKKEVLELLYLQAILDEKCMDPNVLYKTEPKNELQLYVKRFKSNIPPLFSTHYMANEEHDSILNSFKKNNLNNVADDKVKVIYYPIYLTGADHLLDIDYRQCITGVDLGIYPSLYEPWGYTPLETASLAVPAVTTDVSGFGRYMQKCNPNNKGVFILKRYKKSSQEAANELSDVMHKFLKLSMSEKDKLKMEARALSQKADWKVFVQLYFKAHDMAIKNIKNNLAKNNFVKSN